MTQTLAEALQRIGAPRIEATLLQLLQDTPDVSTKEAVEATGLRQPEVSVGMRELVERGWVTSEPIPRAGKGRPMNRYTLSADPARIHVHYEALGQQAKADLDAALALMGRTWSA